jgi:hypothetical protein
MNEVSDAGAAAPTLTRGVFWSADNAALPGVDGTVISALALASIVLSVLIWVRRIALIAALIALLLATVAAVTVVVDYLDINSSIETLRTVYFHIFQVGIGVYVTAIGVTIWAIGAGTGLLGGKPIGRA